MITIQQYTADFKAQWDEAVRAARNSTFLHLRGYMDYHSDRFKDCSLVALDGDRVVAVMPACAEGDTVFSHRGLTYGGWLMPRKGCDTVTMLQVWDAATRFLAAKGFKTLIYKPVPHIYHSHPAEEDLYTLFRNGARLERCDVSSTILLADPIAFDRGNKSNLNAARKNGVRVGESDDWQGCWNIITELLQEKYGKNPVHTLDEIKLLHSRFPENIRLYTATAPGGELLAAVVMYLCGREVAHSQYIASTPRGRELKALPLLFDYLINDARAQGFRHFDFGISTEAGGTVLNEGLISQKNRMGGRATVYNTYSVPIAGK